MKRYLIDYTYECWKCPDRHKAAYVVDAINMDSAVAAWHADMYADFGTTHDYDLEILEIKEITND